MGVVMVRRGRWGEDGGGGGERMMMESMMCEMGRMMGEHSDSVW